MKNISDLSKEELLGIAKNHYFSLGPNDGAASLCKWNFAYGLSKIHYAQEKLGLKPNATFISTPDETITKNRERWQAGYGYGGKLVWNDKPEHLIFIDAKPNACGMLVGGLEELPIYSDIVKRINKMLSEDYYIDDIKINWDFKKGNHFIDVFELEKKALIDGLPPYAFIIHGSAPELRSETTKGIGLYYDKSKTLKEMSKKVNTPFGPVFYLENDDAKEYFNFFLYSKKFAAEKRKKAAELLFEKYSILSNPMHQGLIDYNELLLGSQIINKTEDKLFPIALRSDLPAYLMVGKKSIDESIIDQFGFEKRAKNYDIYERLVNFNVLPHGGGYQIPHLTKVIKVEEIDNERYFICEQENEDAITIITDVEDVQFIYRGKSVINRTIELGLGNIFYKMFPKYILKI